MLKLKHVTKYYGENVGVEDVSFSVKKGRILGLLGSNGSGKSTSFRILLGLIQKTSGEIEYDNHPLDFTNKRLFGYLPEEKSMLRDLKVKDQILHLARLKQVPKAIMEEEMNKWLKYLHIEHHIDKQVAMLSKGNIQLVQLVCALVHQPEILIFDEPLNGLDIENVDLFKQLCWKLKKEGRIILISSHQYNNIEDLCDDVVYLDKGKCLFKGELNVLKRKRKVRIITIQDSSYELWKDIPGVIECVQRGRKTIIKTKDEEIAEKIIRLCLRYHIDEYRCELISLQELIREALYERTHQLLT